MQVYKYAEGNYLISLFLETEPVSYVTSVFSATCQYTLHAKVNVYLTL
jgi:hypothetical protein